jgi:hypothetical protein
MVLEPPAHPHATPRPDMAEPRAVRVPVPDRYGLSCENWIGGAHSASGDVIHPIHLRDAWLVDCARDMPDGHYAASAAVMYRVFSDSEQVPDALARIDALAASLADTLRGVAAGGEAREHPAEPPARLYVMCTQGLNRSGLMTGRLLLAPCLAGDEAVAALRSARPGALNNLTFLRLVAGDAAPP